ncbi:MAG: hypothetical protein ACRDQ1_14735 [Sciscionella sp.]
MEDRSICAGSMPDIQRQLRQLARATGTDVEGVVSWLAATYDPGEALTALLTP